MSSAPGLSVLARSLPLLRPWKGARIFQLALLSLCACVGAEENRALETLPFSTPEEGSHARLVALRQDGQDGQDAGPSSAAPGLDSDTRQGGPALEAEFDPVESTLALGDAEKSEQADWGLAAVVRTADIPFEGSNSRVSSFIPMMFYEGERFFLRGLSGGAHLWNDDETEVNLLARARFFDIPAEFQNEVQGDTADLGLQLAHEAGDLWFQGEWMTDEGGRQHLNGRIGGHSSVGKFDLIPSVTLRYKTGEFNSHYFALTDLTNQSAGSGWELKPNLLARYHLVSDLYLVGSVGYTFFDQDTQDLQAVSGPGQAEVMIGFGFFQHRNTDDSAGFLNRDGGDAREISTPAYVRLAHGWGTPSSLGDILSFDWEDDEFDNQLTSAFYGHPLTDELFGVPLDIYLTPGIVVHHSSDVQDTSQEYVLAIKAYYTVNWPTPWRIGVAEGLSWASDITYIERTSLEEKGYNPSQLMNYLDFSFDVNMGDLFRSRRLERLWLGWSIHHRSSIFESASQFGRIKGGSNYNTVYLQYELL